MLEKNTQLPLFPLNVVLFPGMMLPLHIFEERYLAMVKSCLEDNQPFGVVLAKDEENNENDEPSIFYDIGTTAYITAIEKLDNGRLNLITVGHERFRVTDAYAGIDNYLVGSVDPFPIDETDEYDTIEEMTNRLRLLMKRYLGHLAKASGEDLSGAQIPADPTALAFLVGTAIQGPYWSTESEKQKLLATSTLRTLIRRSTYILDKEDQFLVYMIKAYNAHQKIDRPAFIDYCLN